MDARQAEDSAGDKPDVPISLGLVLRAIPEALEYAQEPVSGFADLTRLGYSCAA